jgi:hypothetical protein
MQYAYERLMKRPGGPELVATAARSVSSGNWSDDFLMAVGLTVRNTTTAHHQILAVAAIHHNIMLGRILQLKVRALGEAEWDSERDYNAAGLAELAEPFRADVDRSQAMGDEDGWLEWTEPVLASAWRVEDEKEQLVLAQPRRVPLEIGVTKPSRTLMHLRQEHCVARWPYGTDWLTVFVVPDELADFSE